MKAELRHLWLPDPHVRDLGRKLRIAYVSPDLRRHAGAHFIEGTLRHHDHSALEIHVIDVSPCAEDVVTSRLRRYWNQWHRLGDRNDEDIASFIRGQRIDILVDLSGHTVHTACLSSPGTPAPVQVSRFWYMNTTGLISIDYRLTDGGLIRQEHRKPSTRKGFSVCRLQPDFSPMRIAPSRYASGGPQRTSDPRVRESADKDDRSDKGPVIRISDRRSWAMFQRRRRRPDRNSKVRQE